MNGEKGALLLYPHACIRILTLLALRRDQVPKHKSKSCTLRSKHPGMVLPHTLNPKTLIRTWLCST